mmetsp:Transcript_128540/g.363784  ORF Transcript_128540/g.363784 Transcript_128540/m.363784 type:complete len:241 (+) Transcript_128540:242-964(+)
MTTNWSSLSTMTSLNSGSDMTFCWCTDLLVFCLYAKSPSARLRFSPASMRQHGPKSSTRPPAASILLRSSGACGFWSTDRSTACPWRHRTARLSPQFAQSSRRRRGPSRSTSVTTAVLPTRSNWWGRPVLSSSSSTCLKDFLSASFGSLRSLRAPARILGRSCTASSATSWPPWPSKTPKSAACSWPGSSSTAQVRSSMWGRMPCSPEQKNLSRSPAPLDFSSGGPRPDASAGGGARGVE